MEQQHYERQEPGTPGSPGRNHERNEVAELLIDKTKLVTFSRHASLGREFAKRGYEANLKAGQHYFQCQQMLKYKSKGPWFDAEAKAIGVEVRTLYNYIDLAKAAVDRERWMEILKSFQNLPPAEQELTVANAWKEADKHNQEVDKKIAEAKAKQAEEAQRQKDLANFINDSPPTSTEETVEGEQPPSSPLISRKESIRLAGGGPYALRFDFMTEAMRGGLDVLVKTQNWHGVQKDLIAVIARILNQHGLGTVEELLKPRVSAYSATDEDLPSNLQGEENEDNRDAHPA